MGYRLISNEAPNYDHTGWCSKTHLTCHATLQKYVKGLPLSKLLYVRTDAGDAAKAMGSDNPKHNHYLDTVIYCSQELNRRGFVTLWKGNHE